MKKLFYFTLVLLTCIGCLTACNFSQSVAGVLEDTAESPSKVEEMMAALSENSTSDAKALIHPQAAEKSDAAIAQMSFYLAGRTAASMELVNINTKSSVGTSGKVTQEQVTYQITLNDGDVIYVSAVYLSNTAGAGFISFQLVLGVV